MLYDPPAIGVDFLGRVRALSLTNPDGFRELAATAGSHVVAFLLGMSIVASITAAIMGIIVASVLARRRAPKRR